jgi:hypothetical protein
MHKAKQAADAADDNGTPGTSSSNGSSGNGSADRSRGSSSSGKPAAAAPAGPNDADNNNTPGNGSNSSSGNGSANSSGSSSKHAAAAPAGPCAGEVDHDSLGRYDPETDKFVGGSAGVGTHGYEATGEEQLAMKRNGGDGEGGMTQKGAEWGLLQLDLAFGWKMEDRAVEDVEQLLRETSEHTAAAAH